jgi:hypothetical protein
MKVSAKVLFFFLAIVVFVATAAAKLDFSQS